MKIDMALTEWLAFLLVLLTAISVIYWLLAEIWLTQWLRLPRAVLRQENPPPPVTFFKPLKRDAPRLRENLEMLIGAMLPGDQLVLGVDPGSEAAQVSAEILERFPDCNLVIVECVPGVALNPKISKLIQMTARAQHEHWILSDSEAQLDAKFLGAFRTEWMETGVSVLTAGYRFAHLDSWPQQLDAASTLLTLWPGLAVLQRWNRTTLTLGACTAFLRSDIVALGGWKSFARDLAEDNRLGVELARAGKSIGLSAHVATLASDRLTWGDYWRHQRRVAVTYRVSNPKGFAGSLVAHGLFFSIFPMLFPNSLGVGIGLVVFVATWLARWNTAAQMSQLLSFPIPQLAPVVLVASFVETACWFLSWFSRSVWWGARWWRVDSRGELRG